MLYQQDDTTPKVTKWTNTLCYTTSTTLTLIHMWSCWSRLKRKTQVHNQLHWWILQHDIRLLSRSKDESSVALQWFIADIAPICKVKELHSDNEGEYLGHSNQKLLLDNNIKHTTTTSYTPYQNGKSEISWRSLLEMLICLITNAQLAICSKTLTISSKPELPTTYKIYSIRAVHKPDMRKIINSDQHALTI